MTAAQQTPPAIKKGKTAAIEGIKLLNVDKHIKIADRSEHGWAAVEEYVEDELSDGEEDETKIPTG